MVEWKFKNLIEPHWHNGTPPNRSRIEKICLAELEEQLTLPTSHCGSSCYSKDLRDSYKKTIRTAVRHATSIENLYERLLKEISI